MEGEGTTTETTTDETTTVEVDETKLTDDQKALAKANSEAKARRLELREAQAKIKEFEDASKSEVEKAQSAISELTAKVAGYERDALKSSAAAEAGLPLKYAARLVGDTAEELLKDAKALAEDLVPAAAAGSGRPARDTGAGARNTASSVTGMNGMLAGARRR